MALPEEVIHSGRVPRIGPYSQAVRVGNLVFTAGQAGIDPATGLSAGPTFEAQARQALANLRELAEMVAKSNTEAADVLTKRIGGVVPVWVIIVAVVVSYVVSARLTPVATPAPAAVSSG